MFKNKKINSIIAGVIAIGVLTVGGKFGLQKYKEYKYLEGEKNFLSVEHLTKKEKDWLSQGKTPKEIKARILKPSGRFVDTILKDRKKTNKEKPYIYEDIRQPINNSNLKGFKSKNFLNVVNLHTFDEKKKPTIIEAYDKWYIDKRIWQTNDNKRFHTINFCKNEEYDGRWSDDLLMHQMIYEKQLDNSYKLVEEHDYTNEGGFNRKEGKTQDLVIQDRKFEREQWENQRKIDFYMNQLRNMF